MPCSCWASALRASVPGWLGLGTVKDSGKCLSQRLAPYYNGGNLRTAFQAGLVPQELEAVA